MTEEVLTELLTKLNQRHELFIREKDIDLLEAFLCGVSVGFVFSGTSERNAMFELDSFIHAQLDDRTTKNCFMLLREDTSQVNPYERFFSYFEMWRQRER